MQQTKPQDTFQPFEPDDASQAGEAQPASPAAGAPSDQAPAPEAGGFIPAGSGVPHESAPASDPVPAAEPADGFVQAEPAGAEPAGAGQAAGEAVPAGQPAAAPAEPAASLAAPAGGFDDIRLDNTGGGIAMAFVEDETTARALADCLDAANYAALIRPGGIRSAVESLAMATAPLLFIDLSRSADPLDEIDDLADVCDPGTTVIAIGDTNDVQLFRGLMGAGVTDYLVKPLNSEMIEGAIENAVMPPATVEETASSGTLIAFVGAHGGVGTTTLAVNTAWSLATERDLQVAIVDLDLKFGAVSLAFDIEAGRGLREALQNPERIDGLFVAGAAVGVTEKLYVLGSEEPLEDSVGFQTEALEQLLTELRSNFDVVILDVPRRVAVEQQSALKDAAVVIVSDLSLLGVRDTLRLGGFAKRSATGGKVLTVVNRVGHDKKAQVPKNDFEKGIETKIDVLIPEDSKTVAAAHHAGKAIASINKRSKIVGAVRAIGEAALKPEEEEKERQSFWRRKKKK